MLPSIIFDKYNTQLVKCLNYNQRVRSSGVTTAPATPAMQGVVYKIPYRRARAWPSGCSAFRPSASREQRYLAYNAGAAPC